MSDDYADNSGLDKETPPWLQPVPVDDGDDQTTISSALAGKKTLVFVASIATVLVGLFTAAIWYLYEGASSDAPTRHVTAPEGEARIRPVDRGGMEVEHQDKGVFDRAAGIEESQESQLAEGAETPVESLPIDNLPEEEPTSAPVVETTPETAPSTTETQPEKTPAVAAPAPEPVVQSSEPVFRVQLGAYGTEKSASGAWRGVRGKFPSLVAGLTAEYEEVKAGGRTLYRLRLTPLPDRAAADALCVDLRSQDQPCIVVKP